MIHPLFAVVDEDLADATTEPILETARSRWAFCLSTRRRKPQNSVFSSITIIGTRHVGRGLAARSPAIIR
jgi:hypothetical protein